MCPPSTISQPLHVPSHGLPVQTSMASVPSASSHLGQCTIDFAVLQSQPPPPPSTYRLERGRAPLHQPSEFTQQHAGVISLDSDFLYVVDTGAQTSVIAASTVQQLVSSGAITESDVLTLQHKRYVQSWDKQSSVKTVDTAVTLTVTVAGQDGSTTAFRLPFLILPHLSKDAIIGRDFLQRQRYMPSLLHLLVHACSLVRYLRLSILLETGLKRQPAL